MIFCENKKKIVGGGGVRVGGQGGCEKRSKVFVKIKKKNIFWGAGSGRGGGGRVGGEGRCNRAVNFCDNQMWGWCSGWGGGQGGCERRIEVFVKIKKKKLGGGRLEGGRQGGCERRIKVFEKIRKKSGEGGGGRVFGLGGVRVGGVRVDVNEELKFL